MERTLAFAVTAAQEGLSSSEQVGVGHAASMQLAVSVAGSPTAAAMLSAQVATVSALSSLLLSPSGAALSDRIGRKPCMLVGVVFSASSGVVWRILELFWSLWRPSPFCFVVVPCALSALIAASGGSLASQASLDDVLASQPARSAAVASRCGFWSGTSGLAGTVIGARLLTRAYTCDGSPVRLCVSLALTLQLCGLFLACCLRETLPPLTRKRGQAKGWTWACCLTNPFSNVGLMLRNGARLRQLTCANLLLQIMNGNNTLLSTFALDQLDWTPADLSVFSAFQSASDMVAQGLVLPMLFRRRTNMHAVPETGPSASELPKAKAEARGEDHDIATKVHQKRAMQRAFLVGSLGSISSCLMMSQCWRPSGGRHWHTAVVMVMAEGLRAGIGRACIATMRTMLVSTALQDCPSDTGIAEVNAALLGMKTLCAGTGMGWVVVYNWCSSHGQPGGPWLLAAAGRCIVHAIVATCSLA